MTQSVSVRKFRLGILSQEKDLRATLSRTISRKQYIAFNSTEKRKFAQAVRASPQDGAVHFASYLGSGIFFGHTVRPRSDGHHDRERG